MSKYELGFGYSERFEDEAPLIDNIFDRFQHTYIVGKTGMGKSSLMERMALYDMKHGNAVIYLDPHGNSAQKLYSLAPNKDNTIFISIDRPKVINPLDKGGDIFEVINEFVQIMDNLTQLSSSNVASTVFMKEILRNAILIIDKDSNKNIKYLVDFLMYEEERAKVNIKDEDLKRYWKEFDEKEKWSRYPKNKEKIETAKRVASRLQEISSGKMKDFIIGRNELDISEVIEKGTAVIVDTSHMSENARIYLSNLIVYSILSYCEFSKAENKPCLIYVDEFQIVVSKWFSDLLARARHRQIGFTLAHQSLEQIQRNILSTILGNAHTMITFRTGIDEADRMSKVYDIKSRDLINLEKYCAWLRIGTKNMLIQCYPPLKDDNPIAPPITPTYNFLDDTWF